MDAMTGTAPQHPRCSPNFWDRTLVDLDFENRLPPIMSTIGAHAMRNLGVTTVLAIVDGHTLSFVMGATLPLALLRGPLFWNGHTDSLVLERPE